MDKEFIKIGVASSDGIVVNKHFGRTDKFYIYQTASEDKVSLLEIRNVIPICEAGNHDDEKMRTLVDKLTDLEFVIVSRIGQGARNSLIEKGIDAYELPMLIQEAIEKVISYRKVQQLLYETFH